MHTPICDDQATLQLMGTWLPSCSKFQPTIRSSYSWLWMNLQGFMGQEFKLKAIWSYNWEFLNLHLHEFCDYGHKLIGK